MKGRRERLASVFRVTGLVGCLIVLGCTEPNPAYRSTVDGRLGCMPGDRQCAGPITQVCSGDGVYLNERQCPGLSSCIEGVCVPGGPPCASDESCATGQVCTIFVNPQLPSTLGTYCAHPLGGTLGGRACADHRDCQTGFCLKRFGLSFCFTACDGPKSCLTLEYKCVPVQITVNGIQGAVDSCAPR